MQIFFSFYHSKTKQHAFWCCLVFCWCSIDEVRGCWMLHIQCLKHRQSLDLSLCCVLMPLVQLVALQSDSFYVAGWMPVEDQVRLIQWFIIRHAGWIPWFWPDWIHENDRSDRKVNRGFKISCWVRSQHTQICWIQHPFWFNRVEVKP